MLRTTSLLFIVAPLLVVLPLNAHGARLAQARRPLRQSAAAFSESCSGNDINVPKFIRAAKAYCDLVARFGHFSGPSAAEVRRCIVKLEDAARSLANSASGGRRGLKRNSMRAILQAEVATGMHGRGGAIADPSAAMGLLWTRRGLAFWLDVFQQHAKKSGGLRAQMSAAYERTLAPFHGWVSRRAFLVASSATPTWEDVCKNADLAPSDELLREDQHAWASALRRLVRSMQAMQAKYDLEDSRRTI